MQSKFALIIAAAIAAVAAAFAGGYFLSRQSLNQPQPPAQVAQIPANAPVAQGPVAEAPTAAPEQSSPAPAPAPYQSALPTRRHHDYADREYEAAPPTPPPPPRPLEDAFAGRPGPFQGRFSEFPMHHDGNGTIESPLTFVAQTTWGYGHEADLRVSLVVPEPSQSDHGAFWREWGARDRVDLMPDVTRGTPVVVTGSASAIVAVDPAYVDLDAPAALIVGGPDGERSYRSRDVSPARGASWDSRGVRWVFAVDEDLYRMLRNGAGALLVVRHRARDGEHDIQIPFSTSGFQEGARAFEWQLHRRINDIAMEWKRSQPGGGMNPPPANDNGPPPGTIMKVTPPPPDNGNPPPQQGYGSGRPPQQPVDRRGQSGDGGGPNGGQNGPWQPRNTPAPGTIMKVTPFQPQAAPATPLVPLGPPAQSPAPPKAATLPAPAPASLATTQGTGPDSVAKAVAEFRPPTDNCGAQPAYAAADPADYIHDTSVQLNRAFEAVAGVQAWLNCRQQWLTDYQTAIVSLRTKVATGHAALREIPAGQAILTDFQTARRSFAEETNLQNRHSMVLVRARTMLTHQNVQTPNGVPPPQR